MKNDKLKKMHFWVLAGVAPLFTLIAVVMYMSQIGSDVEARTKEIDGKMKEVKAASPKGTKMGEVYDEQKKALIDKREELWKFNWTKQADPDPAKGANLFTWPQANTAVDPQQQLKQIEIKHQKFGEPIQVRNAVYDILKQREVYEKAYDDAVAAVEPTVFPGRNWRNVLRYVNNWTEFDPKSEQVWLILEDLWIQRALLLPINDVNAAAGKFVLDPPGNAQPPFKRTFRNRIWKLDIEIPQSGPNAGKVLQSKITNLTNRIQLFGTGNTMRLKVWLSDQPTAQPMPYEIEGEFVIGGGSKDITLVPKKHTIPPGTDVQKIARIEQSMDDRTTPVRQIQNLVLGQMDARTYQAVGGPDKLKAPKFFPDEAATGTPGTTPGGNTGTPMTTGGEADPLAMLIPPTAPIGGGEVRPTGKGGTPAIVADKNKKRYLEVTDQIRRMPFAVVLVLDQMYVQDALTAYGNSPLRCQVTQFHWQRFRGTLTPSATVARPAEGTPGTGAFAPPTSTVTEGQVTSGLVELTIYGILSLYEKYEPKPVEPVAGTPGTEPPMIPGSTPMPPTVPGTTPPATGRVPIPPTPGSTLPPATAKVPAPPISNTVPPATRTTPAGPPATAPKGTGLPSPTK